jgi:hypothetical protein
MWALPTTHNPDPLPMGEGENNRKDIMKKTLQSLTLGLALLAGVQSATAGEIIFSDNFSNNQVNPPTFAKTGVQWVVDKGDLGTNGTAVGGNRKPTAGELNFGTEPGTKIHLDLATPGAESSRMTAMEFSLRDSNGAKGSNNLFTVRLEDAAVDGAFYDIKMALNPKYFNKSGVALYAQPQNGKNRLTPGGEGAAIRKNGPADTLRIEFDAVGGVTLKLNGEEVLNAPNSLKMTTVNRISFINESGRVSYFVDNVIVEGVAQ